MVENMHKKNYHYNGAPQHKEILTKKENVITSYGESTKTKREIQTLLRY